MDEQNQQQPQQPVAPQGGGSDAEKNKVMAIVGYIIPILFFIPLVSDGKNSPFARFHANQQLILLIASVAGNIILTILAAITFGLGGILLPIFYILILVLVIMGAINASKGEMKKLPMIGGFNIIK